MLLVRAFSLPPARIYCALTSLFVCFSHLSYRQAGMDPNIENPYNGNTPLHEAAKVDNVPTMEVLLKFGANPFLKNKYCHESIIMNDVVYS